MTMDCQEIAVNAVKCPRQRGTVLYAYLPYDTRTITGHGANRTADKVHLISILWEHLVEMEVSPWTDFCSTQIIHGQLGRPQLVLGEHEGPAISFSEGGGRMWAALCADVSDIGIDVAGADEFPQEYPFGRVFHIQELQHALRLTGGDLGKASALLWSIKEAVVKAVGCAFHLVDPQQMCVYPSASEKDGWHISEVCVSEKALARFPAMANRCILVRSLFQEKMWLSIALLNRTERP